MIKTVSLTQPRGSGRSSRAPVSGAPPSSPVQGSLFSGLCNSAAPAAAKNFEEAALPAPVVISKSVNKARKSSSSILEENPVETVTNSTFSPTAGATRGEAVAPAPRKIKVRRAKPGEISLEVYGARVSKRVRLGQIEVPESEAPKKRRTKAEREARKQLIRPDDEVMQRLQLASTLPAPKKVPRPKGWRFDCGRCGRTAYFQTLGALCECGAIAVKE